MGHGRVSCPCRTLRRISRFGRLRSGRVECGHGQPARQLAGDPVSIIKNIELLSPDYLHANMFADDAVRVLGDTIDRARDRGLTGDIPESLVFWSLLNWEKKMGLAALEHAGADCELLRRDVGKELDGLKPDRSTEDLDFRAVCELASSARDVSQACGDQHVGSEHLVLALCQCEDSIVQLVLARHGLTYDAVASSVDATLGRRGQ